MSQSAAVGLADRARLRKTDSHRVRTQSGVLHRLACVAGRTQEALYAEIDLELSWSEDELPQVERTKHVHSLHPYLGKFIPQLVDVFLHRYFTPGDCVYDPFAGSGTTLVEANVFGAASVGCDISAFNCLLSRVKTASYSLGALELGLKGALEEARRSPGRPRRRAERMARAWYSERALRELLAYRSAVAKLDRAGLRRGEGHPQPLGPLGSTDHALRSRLSAHAATRAVLVPQAQPHLPPGRRGAQVPTPLHARHDPAAARVLYCFVPARGRRPSRRRT